MLYDLSSVIVTSNALVETNERLFPYSKHRSRRVRKKLLKRFGGEFRMKPAAFKTPQGFIVHPAIYVSLRENLENDNGR